MSITTSMPCPSGLFRDLVPVFLLFFQLALPETGAARSAGRFPAPDPGLKIACNSLNLLKAEKRSHGYSFDTRYWELRRDPCPNCPDPDKRRLAIMIAKRQGGSAQAYYDKLTDPDFVKKRVEDNVAGLVSIGSLFIPWPKIFGWGSNTARSSNLLKPLGLGSTGRTTAANLTEQLAMKEIMSNPAAGQIIKKSLSDPRWQGWTKMTNKIAHGVEIHFNALWENGAIKAVDDFKFITP